MFDDHIDGAEFEFHRRRLFGDFDSKALNDGEALVGAAGGDRDGGGLEVVGRDGEDRFVRGRWCGEFGGLFGGWGLPSGFEIIGRDIEEHIDVDGAEVPLNGDEFVVGGECVAHACGRCIGRCTWRVASNAQRGVWGSGLVGGGGIGGEVVFGAFERRDESDFDAIVSLNPSQRVVGVLEEEVPDIFGQTECVGHTYFLSGPKGRRTGGVWSALAVKARQVWVEAKGWWGVEVLFSSGARADPSFDPCCTRSKGVQL